MSTIWHCVIPATADIYRLRQSFQDLTDPHSCISQLLSKSQSQAMKGEDLDFARNSRKTGVSSKSISENQLSRNETGAGARACLVDILPWSSPNETEHEPLLRCPWCSKHVRKSVHKLHIDQCYKEREPQPLLPSFGPKRLLSEVPLAAQIQARLARNTSQLNVPVRIGKVRQKSALHKRTHKTRPRPRKVACPECGETVTEKFIRRHMQKVHERKFWSKAICDIYARPCASLHRLKFHRFSHLSEAEKMALPLEDVQVLNAELEKNQTTKAMYARRKRTSRRPVKCPECTKVLINPIGLKNHIKLVHRCQSKHVCDICGKPTNAEYALKLHRTTHFGAEEKLSIVGSTIRPLCSICGTSFKDQGTLKSHITRVHEKICPTYTCEKCGYKVKTKKCFNAHVRAHEIQEGDKYFFAYGKCPMKFKFKGEKRRHVPSCPGEAAERPFSCIHDGCDKRFKYRHVLELHLNEFHEYGPEKAREMLYPEGLPERFKKNPKPVGKKWRTKKRTQKSQDS